MENAPVAGESRNRRIGTTIVSAPEFLAGLFVVILLLILQFGSPYFLNINNLASLQTSVAPAILVGIGMTILFVTGAFDLSVGGVMGLAGLIVAWLLSAGWGVEMAIAGALLAGAAAGSVNGFFAVRLGMNPLIVTLGMLYISRGVIDLMIGGGRPQPWMYVSESENGAAFSALGALHIGPFHVMLVVALVLALAADFYMRHHVGGRRIYLTGSNAKAARSLAIPVFRIRFAAFVLTGFLAALAGILITARTGLASRHVGAGFEMEIIIACLIGGASIAGGKGTILGTVLGAVFITLVNNAFNLFEIPAEWQNVVIGAVLIGVVVGDGWKSLRARRYLI